MHQSTTPSLSQTIWARWASRQFLTRDFRLFPKLRGCRYEKIKEMKEAVTKVIDTLKQGLPWGLPEVVGMVQQAHCSRRRLLWRGLEFHVCTINKSAHMKKSGNLFNDPRRYIYVFVKSIRKTETVLIYKINKHKLIKTLSNISKQINKFPFMYLYQMNSYLWDQEVWQVWLNCENFEIEHLKKKNGWYKNTWIGRTFFFFFLQIFEEIF